MYHSPTPQPSTGQRAAQRRAFALWAALITLLGPTSLTGAEPSGQGTGSGQPRLIESGAATITPSLLESKLKAVDAATDLDDAAKGKLAEQYRKALSHLEAAKSFEAKAGTFAKSLTDAPSETARLRALQDAEPESPAPAVVPAGDDLKAIEQRLAKLMAEAAVEEARLGELDKALEAAAQRPADVRSRLADIKQKLEQVSDLAAAGGVEGEDPDLAQARLWARHSEHAALLAEGRMLDHELASLDVRTDLVAARRDQSRSVLKSLRSRQAALEAAANERRLASAKQAKAEAEATESAVQGMAPQVQDLARDNTALGAELTELSKAMERIDRQRTELQTETKRLEEDFRNVRQRLDVAGTTAVLGPILDDKRRQLPDPRTFRKAIAEREKRTAETALAEIRYREELRQLRDLDAYLDQAVSGVAGGEREQLRADLVPLAKRRINLIEQSQGTSASLVRGLSELNFLSSQLLETVEAYDAYLAERSLWVRSVLPLNRISILGLGPAMAWLLSPANWGEVLQTLGYQATHSPLAWILALACLVLLGRTPFLRRDIRATAEPLRKIRTDAFAHTLKAIVLSALVAAPVSLLMALLGWQLATSTEATAFAKQVGLTLTSLAVVLYNLRSFRVLCMPGGVADKHFRWPSDVVARLHRVFGWAVHLALPFGFVAQLIYFANDPALAGSLGRLSVLILALALALLFAYLLHPTRGVLKYIIVEHPNGWASRLRNLWYPLSIAVPVTLAGFALSGYLHAAGVLLESITHSFWLALSLIMVHQSIARWLLVTRRSLALQAALDRAAARKTAATTKDGEEGESAAIEEPVVDLAALDSQTRRLVGALVLAGGVIGLWMVWSDVLPAFTVLDRFELWHHPGLVDGKDQMVPVTLADLLIVLAALVTAVVAGRNLPALLEITLLRYTDMSAGGRYTVTTVTGYVITASAILFVFGALGLNWSQLQWLVAALGVGIGFGLQEIVANFISGLIILFERPVRVGDVITIGGTTGTVTRIQIRATTIRNYDQQELLVPNKQFITGELLNWSLSDQVNRVIITVGVEYGSDTRKAMALMTDAARENPRVLKEPAPLISFEGFGDNALTLILRCYLGAVDGRLGVTTELHQAVYDKLTAAGIGIAFPQRDVHLTADKPLDIRIQGTPLPAAGGESQP